MALLISCLKQVVKFCFVEQWRARVFLVLNMVLLAIYFCSIYAKSESEESNCNEEMKIKKRRYRRPVGVEAGSDSDNSMKIRNAEDEIEQEEEQKQEHDVKVDDKSTTTEISEEELNKRVEAFIAMFRQQLASDERSSRNHQFLSSKKQTENLRSQKECNLTQKVRCVVVQV